jgi:tetratricopeptide (TPR) repeat protein
LTVRGRSGSIAAHHGAAQNAINNGHLREAHRHCLAILALDPDFADAWFLCGVIAAHNGVPGKSADIFRKAIALAPGNAEYHAELGKQLIALRQPREALAAATTALSLAPDDPPTLNTLGTVFSHCGEHDQALLCYEQAVLALQRRSSRANGLPRQWQADLYFNLAASLQFAGQFESAEEAYEKAIDLQPHMFRAHAALSGVRRQTPARNHVERLEKLRDSVITARDQLQLGHAIAKEQEDLELWQESLASLAWAKRAQAGQVAYSAAVDAELFAGIKRVFTRELFSHTVNAAGGCDNREPIFIVGMPRTGTTLVEQILGGHSRVYAAGELLNFPQQVKHLSGSPSMDVLDIETLARAGQLDMAQLGAAYIDSTRPRTGHTPYFIDKLPINFIYLGLIKLALPNAKLICLRRDPMDTCLSNYRQLFGANFKYYHYNYDLLDCGRYYLEFDRLLRHWHETMPGAVFELQYETLVENPEQAAKKLLAHCELPWEDQCLSFHQRKTSVATASAVQVRQDIYTTSVNRWQRYGDALQPLYELLKSAGLYS